MRLCNFLFCFVFIFSVNAAFSQKIMMKIAGITPANGEQVKALEFKTEAETSMIKGGGASVGIPTPGELLIKKNVDTSTSEFLRKMVSGYNFAEIVFEYIDTVGSKSVTTYIITLSQAYVTQAQWLTPECPGCLSLEHQLGFVFSKIKFDDPIRKKVITWNIPQMKIE